MMTISIPQYLLESSFCLLLFYGFYHFWLRRETFFQLNRIYLLASALLSLLIPLFSISLSQPAPASAAVPLDLEYVLYPAVSNIQEWESQVWAGLEKPAPLFEITLGDVLLVGYALGALMMASLLIRRLWSLLQLIRRSRRRRMDGVTLVQTEADFPAASFFGYIFWNAERLKEKEPILQHELVHIRQWHSLDVLLMELIVVLKWFNPLIYLYRKSLQATHEYIADRYVVQRSGQAYQYAGLLVQQAKIQSSGRLVNTFNSLIKNRLVMLSKSPSQRWNGLKYLGMLPLLAGLLLLFSFDLAERLPGAEKVAEVEQMLGDLGQQTLVNIPAAPADPSFQLQWGDQRCDCYPDELENYYHCENLSLRRDEFRRLLRRKGGFFILEDDRRQVPQAITVTSKRTLQVKGVRTQMLEMDRFDAGADYWSKLRKGDVLKLTFRAGEKHFFKFNVTLNDRRESIDYAYLVFLGEQRIAIDMENHLGIKYLSTSDFREAIRHELRLVKNENEEMKIDRLEIFNQGLMLEQRLEGRWEMPERLEELIAVRETAPGNRINFRVHSGEEQLDFAFVLKGDQKTAVSADPVYKIRWGHLASGSANRVMGGLRAPGFSIKESDLQRLQDATLKVRIDGVEREILEIEGIWARPMAIRSGFSSTKISQEMPWQERLQQSLQQLKGGYLMALRGIRLGDGLSLHMMVEVQHDVDPAEFYRDGRSRADYDEAERVITFHEFDQLDWDKLRRWELVEGHPPHVVIDDEKYFSGPVFDPGEKETAFSGRETLSILQPADLAELKLYLPDFERSNRRKGALTGVFLIKTRRPEEIADRMAEETTIQQAAERESPSKPDTSSLIRINPDALVDSLVIVVVDGKRVGRVYQKPLSGIDLNAIEKVTVYRGRKAVNRFGEEARHGAIEIITKRGVRRKKKEWKASTKAGDNKVPAVSHNSAVQESKEEKLVEQPEITLTGLARQVEATLRVFPNAARERATVQFTLPEEMENVDLAVFNLQGKQVTSLYEGALPAGAQEFELTQAQVNASGTFFIRLSLDEQAVLTRKVVFE